MNIEQIQLQLSVICSNRARLLQLEHELENPRIRNITGRQNELRALEHQIKEALFMLWEAGFVTFRK
jgi:hypothetical protein